MKNNKRRRAIDISEPLYELMKLESIKRGARTPTNFLSKILVGGEAPISGDSGIINGARHSVSMTEALWLAVRKRKEARGLHMRLVVSNIILGADSPLSNEEIYHGVKEAKNREQERSLESCAEAPLPETDKDAKIDLEIDREYKSQDEEPEEEKNKRSIFLFQPKPEARVIDVDKGVGYDEFYGGVKLF